MANVNWWLPDLETDHGSVGGLGGRANADCDHCPTKKTSQEEETEKGRRSRLSYSKAYI
jgi:hypothetical protein